MVHAVSANFERSEHMSMPALGMAVLLHVLVAAFLLWAPIKHHDEPDPIEITMEAPPPPEPKPEVEQPKPAPPPPKPPALDRLAQPPSPTLPGLPPAGVIGPKSTAPPMERGLPTYKPPSQEAEQPKPKEEPAQKDEPAQKEEAPQQAIAKPAEPAPPPPPPPTLEKELPPVEAPPAPVTSRDIPRFSPPVPEHKPEPPRPQPQPQQRPPPPRPQATPAPQLAPSPLSRLPRNAPSQRQNEQPRSTFVNPADTFAQNTAMDAYLQRVVYQVSRYRFEDDASLLPTDSVVARFTISRNGSLLAINIARSSGKPRLDRAAVTAFQQASPFPPLPAEAQGDSMTFTMTFFPGRGR